MYDVCDIHMHSICFHVYDAYDILQTIGSLIKNYIQECPYFLNDVLNVSNRAYMKS